MDALKWAAQMSFYIEENHFYDAAAKMTLWKLPKANLENPDQMEDSGRELWQIWDRDTSITDFSSREAQKHINFAMDGNVLC